MPLSKSRDRERKRLAKFQPNSNLNGADKFQPKPEPVSSAELTKVEYIPWYVPGRSKPGDRVRMRDAQGRVRMMTVPELDADGNPIQW